MKVPLPLALMLVVACTHSPLAPSRPVADEILFTPACDDTRIFWLSRDDGRIGIFLFLPGAIYRDTVPAGEHSVGYTELNDGGWPVGPGDARRISVHGPTTYTMNCN